MPIHRTRASSRRVFTLLTRSASIAVALVALYWLGQAIGPQNAVATVYLTESGPVSGVLLEQQPQPGGERVLVVNGNRAYLEISRSALGPDDFISRLTAAPETTETQRVDLSFLETTERQLDDLFGLVKNNAASAMSPLDPADIAQSRADAAIAKLAADFAAAVGRPFWKSGEGWAAYGRISPGGVGPLAVSPEAAFQGRFVLAMRPDGQQHTTIWNLRLPRDFDLTAWLPQSSGDVAGEDPSVLARYPTSRRVFSLLETSLTGRSEIVVFDAGGTVEDHVRHYLAEAEKAGLQATRSGMPQSSEQLIHMIGSQREITVFVSHTDRQVRDVIQVRTNPG